MCPGMEGFGAVSFRSRGNGANNPGAQGTSNESCFAKRWADDALKEQMGSSLLVFRSIHPKAIIRIHRKRRLSEKQEIP